MWVGPGRVGKEGEGEEERRSTFCVERDKGETEAGTRRMEIWVKGFGKMQGGKEGAPEGKDERRVTITMKGQERKRDGEKNKYTK